MHPRCDQLMEIFTAGVNRVDPYTLVNRAVRLEKSVLQIDTDEYNQSFDLETREKIVVVGAGKATARMALAVEHICGDKITSGCIVVKYGHTEPLKYIRTVEAGHPIPDEKGVLGSQAILSLCAKADEKTLVLNLISGGGSALLPNPCHHRLAGRDIAFTLGEKQTVTRHLLECGATITEINCIRKHLSGIKGGQLARAIHPATSLSLILSDVVGDSLDAIASGPTVPDPTSYADAHAIIDKYGLAGKIPKKMMDLVRLGMAGSLPETPKPNDPLFDNSANVLIGTNYLSLQAAAERAGHLGFTPIILSSQITGEAREVAKVLYGIGRDAKKRQLLGSGDLCIISGGETTVTIRGSGKGGRNQEMALSFLAEMESSPTDAEGLYFLSAATDGNDGPTDAAGACVSNKALELAKTAGCNITTYLNNNNAYAFFDRIGHLVKTGPTNTNVCDLQVMLVTR
ncbi:MAG: glycerate kinase [Desulfobacterales bacterium]|nr:glycerate kinase [Desulfobacterales bacterium]